MKEKPQGKPLRRRYIELGLIRPERPRYFGPIRPGSRVFLNLRGSRLNGIVGTLKRPPYGQQHVAWGPVQFDDLRDEVDVPMGLLGLVVH